MGEELKTLKDLDGVGYGTKPGFYTDSFMVDSHKLKIEAIKWIKFFSIKTKDGVEMSSVAIGFKKFFNVTNEGLKTK